MITRRGLVATGGALAAAGGLAACDRLTGGQQQAASKDVVSAAGKAPATAPAAAPTPGAPAPAFTPNPNWTKDAFEAAMAASGRPTQISQAVFDAIQARKPAALATIERYLTAHFGAADPGVMAAFQAIPREYYHYAYAQKQSQAALAYEANAKPWPLGFGSVLSDYLGQAYMTQLAAPKPGETTLEIGTGSGFQSSLLSRMASQSYSIEIIEPIGRAVDQIWKPLGYDNIQGRVGDGYFGWPEVKEGFDIIIVTCVAQYAPPELFRQLKPGGRLLIPIGQPFRRGQVLYVYTKDAEGKVHSRRDVGVFFIPMTGAMQKNPPPTA
ncbi:protein-L-isoaspartate(D-aspartate) O-methyltransferase [Caulobacter ginsengisoli]|uniref:Protein-L-isoaspartate O-methyltransferase n=1 Tax=Caulobacter ginsengisoli TaxID=400775 RepID=A0ABU0IUX7_9CAUL|nr:protein-L-isoaspartate O-methyltransferase [Caulobacter ginsengisoli]MDQ0464938.1 protein-L-isoaspartate(D-aspartate) O-methyltransferase [Caulobacter ginsengisoli]